ncbi:MAG: hypothetical protein ABII88_00265 [Candidatus Omnitrophota bacterium]
MKNTDRRKYIRLNKIFPVEIQVIDLQNKPISDLLQGFTRDVGFEGVCVEINNLKESYREVLSNKQAKLLLFINIPFKHKPVKAIAQLTWMQRAAKPYADSYRLGLSYEFISIPEQKHIMRHARFTKYFPRFLAVCFLFCFMFAGYLLFENIKLTQDNKALVLKLTALSEKQAQINTSLDKIQAEKVVVAGLLKNIALSRRQLEAQITSLEQKQREKEIQAIEVYDRQTIDLLISQRKGAEHKLSLVMKEKLQLEEKLNDYNESERGLKMELAALQGKKKVLANRSLELMYQWIVSSQSSKTGLVGSYDNDIKFMDVGFTYDQALSAFTFINYEEYKKAKDIFNFFKDTAQRFDGGFANAYDIITGKVSEYIVHTGPSIYLGLAMMHYQDNTSKDTYLELTREIGDWLLILQKEEFKGALPGGPELTWTSTEQNIAGYVFLNKLFKITREKKYKIAADKIFYWIKNTAYNSKLKRFNRGEGDRMIATDTVALSILAFGPERLKNMGVSVDDLLNCVEENCRARVNYVNMFGKNVSVTGYDFCSPSSISRSGVICVEWTAQMVVAFKELSNYYLRHDDAAKAKEFMRQAEYYIGELDKLLLIRSTGFGARKGMAGLPYATHSGVDTGHGWVTPDNISISAAGTNFAILAKEEYNIFRQ